MSIKVSDLKTLTDKFIGESPRVKLLRSDNEKKANEIKEILEKDLNSGFTPDEEKALMGFPYISERVFIRLGINFKREYYQKDAEVYTSLASPNIVVFVLEGELNIPETTLKKIIPLNEKIIENTNKLHDIRECFKRHVKKDTSLVWLQKNLPGVYKELKK